MRVKVDYSYRGDLGYKYRCIVTDVSTGEIVSTGQHRHSFEDARGNALYPLYHRDTPVELPPSYEMEIS